MKSTKRSCSSYFSFIYLTLFFLRSIKAVQESDRVFNLPGQPTAPPISHFAGYITVNERNGRALFYWFFEAQTLPSKRPLLLWLNGGPGCSSIGYGAAVELGPLRVSTHATGLQFNKYAWNKEANLLFVESPIGVGFSYTNTSSDLSKLDDGFVAEDAYSFLVNWLSKFPEYQSHDFYIAGESYAGHYVPQLAELVYDHNKDANNFPHINLKGFLVGNPETDDYYDSKGLLEYAWSHSVVSDQVYELAKRVCDFKLLDWTNRCNEAMNAVFKQYNEIDIYNIYAPKCNLPQSSSSAVDPDESSVTKKSLARRIRRYSGYDPCFSNYAEEYFNRIDVQKSLHANVTGKVGRWSVCNDSILGTYNFTVLSVLPIYSKLIRAGLRIWIYSGDTDGRVPVIGSRYCVEALGLPLESQWQPWFLNHQVGGRFVEYKGLSMVTVRGAGHLVPLNKPREALVLVNSFLKGQRLPTLRR
ncbi:serine carboxypeptidase-like 26 [Zingiber officinale]|uniref:Carboxypeptidase n=1 Tax=Zingiber officinale TaxID=94328 RepID=A0A8J5CQ26_ZINOF|nr:serine carboxypeptidase-like 26 [Zingiber officinale]KAG6466590.1 hypothetical protein ZIOFF_075599 [Zingiber officinale]